MALLVYLTYEYIALVLSFVLEDILYLHYLHILVLYLHPNNTFSK